MATKNIRQDLTRANLAVETLQDELDSLRDAFPKFEDMPKAKQDRVTALEGELAEARETLSDVSLEWKKEQRKNGAVPGRLPFGNEQREGAADIYADDEYGYNNYTRMARGRLLNFTNDREGYKRAELAGAMFFAKAFNAKDEMKKRAMDVLTSGEHDLRHYTFDADGRVNGISPQTRDLTSAVESLGGVLVPTILEASIFSLMENYGILMQNAEVRPMAGAKMKWPRSGKAFVVGWTI